MKPTIALIVAASTGTNIIGNGPDIPWPRLGEDLKNLRDLTTPHPIIVGRKTYETFRNREGDRINLPNRLNIVVTRDTDYIPLPGAVVVNSFEDALELAKEAQPEKIWICGGGEIYRQALGFLPDGSHDANKCIVDEIYFTEVFYEAEGDVTFPDLPKGLFTAGPVATRKLVQKVKGGSDVSYHITHYVRT
jgi:dihydrofolate reductase